MKDLKPILNEKSHIEPIWVVCREQKLGIDLDKVDTLIIGKKYPCYQIKTYDNGRNTYLEIIDETGYFATYPEYCFAGIRNDHIVYFEKCTDCGRISSVEEIEHTPEIQDFLDTLLIDDFGNPYQTTNNPDCICHFE